MTWQDGVLVAEAVILVLIYLDDHAMKRMAEDSLKIARESLMHQQQYLALRRKWYESRTKKKDNDKTVVGLDVSDSTNSQ